MSWNEILEGVGSTSAKDALVNNYEAIKQFLKNWFSKDSSLTTIKFHNPKSYFPNDEGSNCIFEMDLEYREPDDAYAYESANVRVYEDQPELFVFEFIDESTLSAGLYHPLHSKTSSDSLPTYTQAKQYMDGAAQNCRINNCLYDPDINKYLGFYDMIKTDLGIEDSRDVEKREVAEKIANHIADY